MLMASVLFKLTLPFLSITDSGIQKVKTSIRQHKIASVWKLIFSWGSLLRCVIEICGFPLLVV